MSNDKTYQIENTKGEWSDLRPDEVDLYVNSNAVTRVKPVCVVSPHPTEEMSVAGQIKSVGEQIRDARIASGLSRTEWGKAIGISRPNTYRIEKEGYNCKLNVLKNVTKLLQITICISSET